MISLLTRIFSFLSRISVLVSTIISIVKFYKSRNKKEYKDD